MNDNQQASASFQLRPFDNHALTYTLREIHGPSSEYQSQHRDAEAAASAFLHACAEARSVELRDPEGRLIAAFTSGMRAA
jgi:hypothetical protein